jgi:hypothetical protein
MKRFIGLAVLLAGPTLVALQPLMAQEVVVVTHHRRHHRRHHHAVVVVRP